MTILCGCAENALQVANLAEDDHAADARIVRQAVQAALAEASRRALPELLEENERAAAIIRELATAMLAYEMDVEGSAPQIHRDMMARAGVWLTRHAGKESP